MDVSFKYGDWELSSRKFTEAIYRTLALTGLRKSELDSVTVGQVYLDAEKPYLKLNAADEKNRMGSDIQIRSDLAADLEEWLDHKLSKLQSEARQRGEQLPVRLPLTTPIFNVPSGLVRILNRDLKLAGIPKRDEFGRTVDVHALRHSFGTHLSKGGVAPRTAQAAMRHSTIDLTMNVYTDPMQLDVREALDALPAMPLNRAATMNSLPIDPANSAKEAPCQLAPLLAPKTGQPGQSVSAEGKTVDRWRTDTADGHTDVSCCPDTKKPLLTRAVIKGHQVERKRFELSTSALRTQRSPN